MRRTGCLESALTATDRPFSVDYSDADCEAGGVGFRSIVLQMNGLATDASAASVAWC